MEDDHLEREVHFAGSGMDPTECQEALRGLFIEIIAIFAPYHVCFSKLYATQLRAKYKGCSSQTGTFNFTGIKTDASMALLHTVVSGVSYY